MRESQGESSGIWYLNFTRLRDFMYQRRMLQMDPMSMRCVGFQVMNRPRQSSLNVKRDRSPFVMLCADFGHF